MSISCGKIDPSIVGVDVLPPVEVMDWFSGVWGLSFLPCASADLVIFAVLRLVGR